MPLWGKNKNTGNVLDKHLCNTSVTRSLLCFVSFHHHAAQCQLASGKDKSRSMDVKNMREYMGWLYYQYLLITGIYVLEPWEKSIFNTVLFTMVAMVVYTSYVFVPIHVRLALEFFSGLCGEQPESTVALMS